MFNNSSHDSYTSKYNSKSLFNQTFPVNHNSLIIHIEVEADCKLSVSGSVERFLNLIRASSF